MSSDGLKTAASTIRCLNQPVLLRVKWKETKRQVAHILSCFTRWDAGRVSVGVRAGDPRGNDSAVVGSGGEAFATAVRHREVLAPA